MNQSADTTVERRRHPRTMLQMAVQCVRLDPEAGDVIDKLHLVDISRTGVGGFCDRPFYPGQRVVLCMPLSLDGGRRNIYATVVRCRGTADGYRVGMAFDSSSSSSICVNAGGACVAA
jgi:hypothetical protein